MTTINYLETQVLILGQFDLEILNKKKVSAVVYLHCIVSNFSTLICSIFTLYSK